jgi:hypothetical protein
MKMITRKEYVENPAELHKAYYEQFVTDEITDSVIRNFTIPRLVDAYIKDENFNTLPSDGWNVLTRFLPCYVSAGLKNVGDYLTVGRGVSILKTAARLVVLKEMDEQFDRIAGQ